MNPHRGKIRMRVARNSRPSVSKVKGPGGVTTKSAGTDWTASSSPSWGAKFVDGLIGSAGGGDPVR